MGLALVSSVEGLCILFFLAWLTSFVLYGIVKYNEKHQPKESNLVRPIAWTHLPTQRFKVSTPDGRTHFRMHKGNRRKR